MTATPRLDIRCAADAAAVLDAIIDPETAALPAEIATRLKDLPTFLRTSGLAATLAFYAAKSGSEDKLGRAYRVVGDRLRHEAAGRLGITADRPTAFFTELATKDAVSVALATAQVRALSTWLSRLAEAVDEDRPPAARRPAGTTDAGGST